MAAVTVNDRPLINVGDPCKIAITGLSEYSYGTPDRHCYLHR